MKKYFEDLIATFRVMPSIEKTLFEDLILGERGDKK